MSNLAKAILQSKEWNQPNKYSLKELFQIRDALVILKNYRLEDKDLLKEVQKFIKQEVKL